MKSNKNIWIIPTTNESKYAIDSSTMELGIVFKSDIPNSINLAFKDGSIYHRYLPLGSKIKGLTCEYVNIHITSKETMVKEDYITGTEEDWGIHGEVHQIKKVIELESGQLFWFNKDRNGISAIPEQCAKVVFTTNAKLIKKGVQELKESFITQLMENPVDYVGICKVVSHLKWGKEVYEYNILERNDNIISLLSKSPIVRYVESKKPRNNNDNITMSKQELENMATVFYNKGIKKAKNPSIKFDFEEYFNLLKNTVTT